MPVAEEKKIDQNANLQQQMAQTVKEAAQLYEKKLAAEEGIYFVHFHCSWESKLFSGMTHKAEKTERILGTKMYDYFK